MQSLSQTTGAGMRTLANYIYRKSVGAEILPCRESDDGRDDRPRALILTDRGGRTERELGPVPAAARHQPQSAGPRGGGAGVTAQRL